MKRARVLFVAGALVLGAASGCGSDKPKAAPAPSSGPVGSASPSAPTTTPPVGASPTSTDAQTFPSEYTVQGTSVCAWQKKSGVIRLTAAFGITYGGTAPAGDVSYTVTEDRTNVSETGTVIASMLGAGTSTVIAGVSAPGFSTAVGDQVTLTITIQAAGDTDTTNNSAIETMTVPAVAATAGDTGETLLNCDGP
jgi:hypothetical protein